MSRTPSVAPSGSGTPALPPIDQYRTLPNALKRPLRFTPSNPTGEPDTAQSLLEIGSIAYTARLASRNLLLVDPPPIGAAKDDAAQRDACVKRGKKKLVDAAAEERAKRRAKKRGKVGVFAREEARRKGVWDVKSGAVIRYDHLVPLHYMYLSYLSEMLPLPAYPKQPLADLKLHASAPGKLANGLATEQLSSRLVKADFTGAVIRVKRSKNASLIGLEGIVAVETAETFKIVTVENVVKIVPKSHALFTITFPAYAFPTLPNAPSASQPATPAFLDSFRQVPKVQVDILGSAFRFRAEDRAGRKFKYGACGGGWGEEWVGLDMFGLE
ncbi:hypothetical protein NliqN6_4341 [Naganishia liquefaciens]|uniref:Uncharacterized protein n=1 Tax=Naganishia liquefaciens TaxID=104408 RepID=A0A8H3YFS3_9TREE|nr:hypothetical protein NliqN6_4341 [Naganishia liquefaciens]